MEKKLARLFIQLFAEDSETTEPEIDEEVETEVEDTEEETETSEPVETEEPTEEPEKVKTFTQDELDNIVETRLKRERNRVTKDYETKLSKYEELAYLAKEGTKSKDYDEALEKSRQYYGKQGITYTSTRSAREEEILANADADEIIGNCESVEDIDAEVKKLQSKGNSMTKRELAVAQILVDEMKSRKRTSDLASLGVKPEVYNSKEFKDFENKFTKDTPIADIYDYYRTATKPTKKVENPGSMKSTPVKENKKYITEAEYDKMTRAEIKANMDLIEKSMEKW